MMKPLLNLAHLCYLNSRETYISENRLAGKLGVALIMQGNCRSRQASHCPCTKSAYAKATAHPTDILTGASAKGDPPGWGAGGGLREGVMLSEK